MYDLLPGNIDLALRGKQSQGGTTSNDCDFEGDERELVFFLSHCQIGCFFTDSLP